VNCYASPMNGPRCSSLHDLSDHSGGVDNALARNAGCHGFAPPLRCLFLSRPIVFRIDTVSGTEELNMVCVTLQEFTVTSDVSGDNW